MKTELTGAEQMKYQEEEVEKRLNELTANDLPPANIIVAGITGTGKSTLINAVFGSELAKTGSGRPVTDHIYEYQNKDIPVHVWDTVGLELDSEKTKQSIKSIKDTISAKTTNSDLFDRVHAIWYCVNLVGNRYQGEELRFVKELHSIGVPFIVVITQCFGSSKKIDDFETYIRDTNAKEGMPDIKIVRTLAKDFEIEIDDTVHVKRAFGLDDLINVTLDSLPTFIKNGLIAAQKVNKNQKRELCEDIIFGFAKAAQEGFWDKVPLINIFTTDKKIMRMFGQIGRIYNTVLSESSVEKIITESKIDFTNNFWGLLAPFDLIGYSKRISSLLSEKMEDGFSVKATDIPKNNRAARMIAFFGYTFIDSIEQVWMKLTESQLQDVDMVCRELTAKINEILSARRSVRKEGTP